MRPTEIVGPLLDDTVQLGQVWTSQVLVVIRVASSGQADSEVDRLLLEHVNDRLLLQRVADQLCLSGHMTKNGGTLRQLQIAYRGSENAISGSFSHLQFAREIAVSDLVASR